MGGLPWDNAPAESWFGRFKNEVIYGKRFTTHDLMKATCFDYIEVFYNRRRLHSSLGYQSPMQYLKDWLAKGKEKLVAWNLSWLKVKNKGKVKSQYFLKNTWIRLFSIAT